MVVLITVDILLDVPVEHIWVATFKLYVINFVLWAAIRCRPLVVGEMPIFRSTATRSAISGALAHSRQMR